MGDVKLCLLIGALLGWGVVGALLAGTVGAGLVSAAILVREGSAARKRSIPLGPFLAGAAVLVLLFL
jgi:prepilin signal peptidase PulO-like enzyme (type II secretory pathway)